MSDYRCLMENSYSGTIEFNPRLNTMQKANVCAFFGEDNLAFMEFTDEEHRTFLELDGVTGHYDEDSFSQLNHSVDDSIRNLNLYYSGDDFGKILFRAGEFYTEDLVYLSEVSDEDLEREMTLRKSLKGMDYNRFRSHLLADIGDIFQKRLKISLNDTDDIYLLPEDMPKEPCILPIILVKVSRLYHRYVEEGQSDETYTEALSLAKLSLHIETPYSYIIEVPFNYEDIFACPERIEARIINFANNTCLLKDVPHRMVEDLVIVYHFVLEEKERGKRSFLITNNHLHGKTEEELYKIATENLRHPNIQTLDNIMEHMFGSMCCDDAKSSLLMISNQNMMHGSIYGFYPPILEPIKEKYGKDFLYIIPSSVHEVLIPLTEEDMPSKDFLEQTILKVNSTVVEEKDFLSNHLYKYEDGKISIVS